MYTLAVLVVVGIEKSLDIREHTGDFPSAVAALFHQPEYYHFWATVLSVGVAFVVYNAFSVVRAHMGEGGMTNLFFKTTKADLAVVERTPSSSS